MESAGAAQRYPSAEIKSGAGTVFRACFSESAPLYSRLRPQHSEILPDVCEPLRPFSWPSGDWFLIEVDCVGQLEEKQIIPVRFLVVWEIQGLPNALRVVTMFSTQPYDCTGNKRRPTCADRSRRIPGQVE